MSKSISNVDSTGSIHLVQFPPSITLETPLLSSIVSLPAKPLIVYAIFTPAASVEQSLHLNVIESARRSLISTHGHLPILESLLPAVQITHRSSAIFVFAISSVDALSTSHSNLNSLSFDGLIVSGPNSFTPQDLYPCSAACSTQRNPCPNCLNPQSPSSIPSSPQSSSSPKSSSCTDCLLPRKPLRDAYSQFLHSIRDHLIHQISRKPDSRVTRYCDGFLLGSSLNVSEWGVGWDHHTQNRSLVHCQIDIHLSPSRLTIHPILRPTHFLSFQLSPPSASGIPIKLLPYGTPAFYLATYSGQTASLTSQFEAFLSGLGTGDWKQSGKNGKDPTYVIAWISVQNKQGEDKGITVIWPTSLCLSFLPSSPQATHVLPYIPELPAQLQPSPPPVPLPATLTNLPSGSPGETDSQPIFRSSSPFMSRLRSSATGDSLRAFRALTLSKSKNVYEIAQEISGYVDSVAKERDRERERIRKEREIAQSSPKPDPSQSNAPMSVDVVPEVVLPDPPPDQPSQVTNSVEHPIAQTQVPSTFVPDVNAPPVAAQPPAVSSYDPFSTFDSWPKPAIEFTNMELDYDMGFEIGMNNLSERSGSGNVQRFNVDIDDGFGAFTDDDFSFFDRPTAPTRETMDPSRLNVHTLDSGLTAGSGSIGIPCSLFNEGTHGPGPPSAAPGQSHPSPWTTSGILGEGFTPRFSDPGTLYAPELMASSPTMKTPSSHSAPVTPAVLVDTLEHLRRPGSVYGPSIFEPIAFASSHKMADEKYVFGKFALPSPPDEEDRTEALALPYFRRNGWKTKYNAITDPRISVVRKLIGAKRKIVEQGERDGKVSPSWVRDQEEWQSSIIHTPENDKSDVDSEEEEDTVDEEDVIPRTGSDRPSTPLPSYLPVGPSLLATQFHHAHLLSISTSLKPPGAAVAPTNLGATVAPISVPTPVSPPAMLGEKSRSLEAAANMLAQEVVENSVWADSWRLNLLGSSFTVKPLICQADVKRTARLFDLLECLTCPVEMGLLFDSGSASLLTGASDAPLSLQVMEPPLLSVGKADVSVEILPPALRFWEKLGLTPRGGRKDVTAFVFFEAEDQDVAERVSNWLSRVSNVYLSMNFGTHAAGTSSSCSQAGVVPVRFESFRKTLPSFIEDLPQSTTYLVFYIAAPASMTTLISPVLRQVFSAAKRASKTSSESKILFQFVSETMVLNPLGDEPAGHSIEALVCSVYDRILKPVDRSMSRRFFEHGAKLRKFFQDPSFALGRPQQKKVSFVQQTPVRSLDVMERHTMLHVGYRISSCGKWLLAACIDQRGETHELRVWLIQHEEGFSEDFVVGQLWDFAIGIGKEANVEWRIVFAKSGAMGERETEAWITKLGIAIPACKEISMFQVTVVSVELDLPWTFVAPSTKPPGLTFLAPPKTSFRFEDMSATTYALFPPLPMALSPVPLKTRDVRTTTHCIEDHHEEPPTSEMTVRALSTATIIRVPADTDYTSISMLRVNLLHTIKSPMSSLNTLDEETHLDIIHNFHELAVLGKVRWRLDRSGVNPILPFHLAALEVIDEALWGELPLD